MARRFCITHGYFQGVGCAECRRDRDKRRGSAHARGYDKTWQRTVAAAIQQHPFCAECGATDDLTGDHITPRIRGGTNHPSNVRVLCRSCNSSKGAKPVANRAPRIHVPDPDDVWIVA